MSTPRLTRKMALKYKSNVHEFRCVYFFSAGVKKMAVVDNQLYILDSEVSLVVSLWTLCLTCTRPLNISGAYCFLCVRTFWVCGTCISLSWFTAGQTSPFMTLNSPLSAALLPWWRKYRRVENKVLHQTENVECFVLYYSQDKDSMRMITLTKQENSQVTTHTV